MQPFGLNSAICLAGLLASGDVLLVFLGGISTQCSGPDMYPHWFHDKHKLPGCIFSGLW